ncbi:MAG TPA: CRISPR-associated endonuclease Cas1 [Lachnospiraceae bacterium]|nr:CRISPR-associated endonuclease Cas1 [Lachnospiraceae bacterium]
MSGRRNSEYTQFLPKRVEALILSASCSLTSEVISLCAENDIPIMMNDRFGMPVWRTEAVVGGSVPLLRRRQLLLAERPEGSELTQALLAQKLEARIVFLRNLASNRRDERGSKLKEAAEQIFEYKRQMEELPHKPIQELRPKFLGCEGSAGRIYFSALKDILPPEADFFGRARGSGSGAFNQMLNYGYGVLYQDMLRLCSQARLDPYIGVMHTDNYNRPTLVYDLVEPFRADVEACVSKLFTRRQIRTAEHFQTADTGPCLSGAGKRILLDTLYQKRKDTKKMSRLVTGLKNGLVQWAA